MNDITMPSETDTIQKDRTIDNRHKGRDEITEENCRFEEGEMISFTRVRFPGHAKSYPFLVGNRSIMYGQKVVAMSDRGMAVGYINSFQYKLPFKKSMLPLKSINKVANDEDITKENDVYKRQKEIETTCQNLIEKHKLDMNMTHVEFTQFGKKVVFYFVAPSRVDFRGLVRDLVTDLKLRIELRQISVRDRAAAMGALGACGRELCCSSFLSKYGNVSIKMAKNQNLTLNYSKLNGVCGQLKCCLSYEEDAYSEKRKKLPNEGTLVKTKTGDKGKVRKLDVLNETFDMMTDQGQIKRQTADQVDKFLKGDEYKFPHRFDNISDETATTVGKKELLEEIERQKSRDFEKLTKQAKKFAVERINELSDFFPPRAEGEREAMLAELEKEEQASSKKKIEIAMDDMPVITEEELKADATAAVNSLPQNTEVKAAPKRNDNRNKNRNRNRNRKPRNPNTPKKE